MPRDGSGVYHRPVGTDAVPDTTIESAKYNVNVADVESDLNLPRPIVAGGTNATSADAALTSLSAEKAKQVVTDFNVAVLLAGSFSAATTASNSAVSGHAFSGLVYGADVNNMVIEARDATDGSMWIRRMTAGVWGSWTIDPSKSYVDTTVSTAVSTAAVRYDVAQTLTIPQQLQARQNIGSTPLRSYMAGLTLSTAGSSATFSVAAGTAADTAASTGPMDLASALNKTTATWAVGTGNGALDTGTIATAAWYHVFLIKRLDTGVVDALVSLSATAPTLPASYTVFRRIGSIKTVASQWVKFVQYGNTFLWDVPIGDVTNSNLTTASTLYTLSIPPGIVVDVTFNLWLSSTVSANVLFSSPLTSVQAANTPQGNMNVESSAAGSLNLAARLRIGSDTQGRIRAVSSAASGAAIYIATTGWIDRRGRDD